jgi:hypothetical protein
MGVAETTRFGTESSTEVNVQVSEGLKKSIEVELLVRAFISRD